MPGIIVTTGNTPKSGPTSKKAASTPNPHPNGKAATTAATTITQDRARTLVLACVVSIERSQPDPRCRCGRLFTADGIRRTIGEYNFAGQYQQSPAPLGGGLVKVEWFKRYRENERPERFDRIVQSWDTANKATELSDFSVCTTWGIAGKNLYLLSVFRRRLEYPALKRAVRDQQRLFGANVVLIEDKASGTQLIQELIADGCHGVTRYQPDCEKIMRLHAQTALIENGFVHIPETAPWLAEYLHEMSVFPKGKHDDQVDSTAQFLDWFKKPFPGQGVFEYHRREFEKRQAEREAAVERRKPSYAMGSMEWLAERKEAMAENAEQNKSKAEKPKPPKPVNVRVKAPPGLGAVQTLSGRRIIIAEDRIVEMSAEDANCLSSSWTLLTE
jgi:predicted phage terminase large subunit-like protein